MSALSLLYMEVNLCPKHVKIHQEPNYNNMFTIDDESVINIAKVYGHGVLVVFVFRSI